MTDRLLAFVALLAQPDPVDLVTAQGLRRGSVLRCEGAADRRSTVLQPLLVRWIQYRHLAVDPDPVLAPVVHTRRWPLVAVRRSA